MIPLISLIIGTYVVTRMWELTFKTESVMVKTLSWATMVITILCVVRIFSISQELENILTQF